MSGRDLEAWITRMNRHHGIDAAGNDGAEPAAPAEMIAGASSGESSYGDVTGETAEEGQDVVTGARENAASNDNDLAAPEGSGNSHPMQSPAVGRQDFALRYAIGFLCSNYPGRDGDLPDVARDARPRSAYRRAFAGMDRTYQYRNPTASEVRSNVARWVRLLVRDVRRLGDGARGQLVVSFQGHGANGNFLASDEQWVSRSTMQSIGRAARNGGVTCTFLLDACESGSAVPAFQADAADHVDGAVDRAEGAGDRSSVSNRERAQVLRARMAHARELISMGEGVVELANQLTASSRSACDDNDDFSWEFAYGMTQRILREVRAMHGQFRTNLAADATPEMGLDRVDRAFVGLLGFLAGVPRSSSFDLDEVRSRVGAFQDEVSDGANRVLRSVDRDARAARAAG